MSINKSLKDFDKIIRECVKCGICQAHCPTYLIHRREGAVARGKIALAAALLAGGIELEERLQEDISLCLMCGSCVVKCPNNVPTHDIVGAVRREITEEQGLSLVDRGISGLLGSKTLKKTAVKGAAAFGPLFLKKVPESSGLHLRFPISGIKDRTLPKIAYRSLFDRFPEIIEGEKGKPLIGFFAGCSISYLFPEIGEAMIGILRGMGYSVYLPKSQSCCGIPAHSLGNGALAEKLAHNNVEAFKNHEVEYIVTACGSCNSGIGENLGKMKADFSFFTDKVIDFSVLLGRMELLERLSAMEKWADRIKVTYHDPCHLKTQGITEAPRQLLKSLPNVDFVEMENASACCGLGGVFSVHHVNTSKAIGAKKIAGLARSGAQVVATACPGCIIQLQDSIDHAGIHIRAVHILELVAEALA
jgi:glycolate oxidase iron-sulfur subunit